MFICFMQSNTRKTIKNISKRKISFIKTGTTFHFYVSVKKISVNDFVGFSDLKGILYNLF